jgi:hypothetical protein
MTETTNTHTDQLIARHSSEGSKSHRRPVRFAMVAVLALMGALSSVAFSSTAGAATGLTGLHYLSAATCRPISSPVVAARSQVAAAAPIMYAANTTSGLDGQTVSFRQRLQVWNGSTWVASSQSAVWSGFATDGTAGLDFSDGSRTLRRPVITFTAGPGYYRVVTDYWWAATGRTSGGSNSAVAQHSPSSTTAYCGFSY